MSGESILVIEDDSDIRELLRGMLERDGFAVCDACDGVEGMRRFYEVRPDLVVLDVVMPGLDGWDVLRRIREVSETPVLLLSASQGELDKVRGLRAGADDYVTKPFGRQELLARIGTHGSAASPISCNSSTSSYVQNTVPLPEVNTPTRANGAVIKLYIRNSSGQRSQHDLAELTVDYTN